MPWFACFLARAHSNGLSAAPTAPLEPKPTDMGAESEDASCAGQSFPNSLRSLQSARWIPRRMRWRRANLCRSLRSFFSAASFSASSLSEVFWSDWIALRRPVKSTSSEEVEAIDSTLHGTEGDSGG